MWHHQQLQQQLHHQLSLQTSFRRRRGVEALRPESRRQVESIEALARRGLLPEVSPKPCASTLSFGLVLLEYVGLDILVWIYLDMLVGICWNMLVLRPGFFRPRYVCVS